MDNIYNILMKNIYFADIIWKKKLQYWWLENNIWKNCIKIF